MSNHNVMIFKKFIFLYCSSCRGVIGGTVVGVVILVLLVVVIVVMGVMLKRTYKRREQNLYPLMPQEVNIEEVRILNLAS